LDFTASSRGWCYILEEHGLLKSEFDRAQTLVNDCRKDGLLPLDFCAEDGGRAVDGLEDIDDEPIDQRAELQIEGLLNAHRWYTPISFWDFQPVYVEMMVEKVDLKSLYGPICEEFNTGIQNASGWNDINSRGSISARFRQWEHKGKQCVLLYCGDHDPGGLHISDRLRSNFADLEGATGWSPDRLIIDRFGLNYDFIEEQGLSWIEGLHTGSGEYPLEDPRHKDHYKDYVQSYLKQFGARKVEANALVVRPEAGRQLCRRAIERYVRQDGIAEYRRRLAEEQERLRR
jgi:hypothetical protein